MMPPNTRWDFFIAHAGADRASAEALYDLLAPRARVFLDARCIKLGDDWDSELAQAQRDSLISVILVSARSEAAYYHREEIAAAIEFAREDRNAHRVVPLYLNPAAKTSGKLYGLRPKHGLTLDDSFDISKAADELIDLLHKLTQPTPPASPRPEQAGKPTPGSTQLVLTETGEVVGGQDALRRVAVDLTDYDSRGTVHVRALYQEKINREIAQFLEKPGLSADDAELLRTHRHESRFVASSLATLHTILQLTFAPRAGSRRYWDTPMRPERAVAFIENLLVALRLAPEPRERSVECTLYIPGSVDDPLAVDFWLSDDELAPYEEGWKQELEAVSASPHLLTALDWSSLIPVWRFDDDFVIGRLLPYIVKRLAIYVDAEQAHDVDATIASLEKHFADLERKPASPYSWTVAVRNRQSPKDLAWLHSPPDSRFETWKILRGDE